MPRTLAVLLAGYSYFLVRAAVPKLAGEIALQSGHDGVTRAAALASTLWGLFAVQVVLGALFLTAPWLMQLFPGQIHLGVCRLADYSPSQRARILPLLWAMSGWVAAWLMLGFVFLIRETIHALHDRRQPMAVSWLVGFSLAGTVAIILYYQSRIDSTAEDTPASDSAP
ncbi:MAG TPA: hypothetical protein VGS20_10840 [Candidatus Acidoferrales bacterium]|nr:hypothetical protein [Candidatus Acidoferrales bacterium]